MLVMKVFDIVVSVMFRLLEVELVMLVRLVIVIVLCSSGFWIDFNVLVIIMKFGNVVIIVLKLYFEVVFMVVSIVLLIVVCVLLVNWVIMGC